MKMIYQIILVILVIFSIFYLFFRSDIILSPSTQQNLENKVCFGENCFFVELAKNKLEIEKGLMNRDKLAGNEGMLFIFPKEKVYSFWMKNTLIPLDIIWIDKNKKVVFIKENAQPCKSLICPSINPLVKAGYVLEINGGLAKKNGIKLNDTVLFQISN